MSFAQHFDELKFSFTFHKVGNGNVAEIARQQIFAALQQSTRFNETRFSASIPPLNYDGGLTRGYRDEAQCACGIRCICFC